MTTLLRAMVTCAVLGFVGWLHAIQLVEAYGSGLPYLSMTTNMDKWSSPIPFLLAVNAVMLATLTLVWIAPLRRAWRAGHGRARQDPMS